MLGLREVSETHVEIIYEQCYPSRRCPISLLKDKIGEELYTKKKVALVKLFELTQR